MGDSIPSLPGKVTRLGASAASLSLEADLGHPVDKNPPYYCIELEVPVRSLYIWLINLNKLTPMGGR